MSERVLEAVMHAAIAEGLLPAAAVSPRHEERPWPVVLLTAIGAWLAALPLIALFAVMLGDSLRHGPGPLLAGLVILGAAIFALRSRRLPLFVEQLITPMLIVGGGLLAWGLSRELPLPLACVALALVAIGSALAIARPWLRVVLGAAAAVLAALAWLPWRNDALANGLLRFWLAWHMALLLWAAAGVAQRAYLGDGAGARLAAALESLRAGWLLATLCGLAWWSGMTFLVGGTLGAGAARDWFAPFNGEPQAAASMAALRIGSLLLAAGAAAWAAHRWPALRTSAGAGVALVLVALAWFMPSLGAALLALSACAVEKRWRLAATAALTAAWIVGGFYYALAWPLATKGAVLLLAGVALGALAWLGFRGAGAAAGSSKPAQASALRWRIGDTRSIPVDRLGIAATALLVLVAANFAIWQKEDLIARGRPVFIELAPVDPRSLMQGDYMRLDFRLPPAVLGEAGGLLDNKRPIVVGLRDERGVVTVLRLHRGEPLAAAELRIELTPKGGEWVIVSDAWSFAEGEAARWAPAKYGEFRLDDKGRAMLVGLRGPGLETL